MMPRHALEDILAASWPPERWQDFSVIVAVSGGADSVALLRALSALKTGGAGRLIVGHFNHGLRPEAADDAAFVAKLADRLSLPIEIGAGDTESLATSVGDGIEAAAREQRYHFLQMAAERLGARYVVTAHTADDQAETIIHRILRGTSVAGLAGMHRARQLGDAVTLLRPLLDARRSGLRLYLNDLQQDFREDASNANREFTRNRIRHDLLPRLAGDFNRDVVAALVRLGETARDAQQVIEARAAELLDRCLTPIHGDSAPAPDAILDCRPLAGEARHLVREVFVVLWRRQSWPRQSMGFEQWNLLADMALGPPTQPDASRTFPGAVLAQKTSEQLSFARLS